MKTIKAWAIVDKKGGLVKRHETEEGWGGPLIWRIKKDATAECIKEHGERVVRVTITVEDE